MFVRAWWAAPGVGVFALRDATRRLTQPKGSHFIYVFNVAADTNLLNFLLTSLPLFVRDFKFLVLTQLSTYFNILGIPNLQTTKYEHIVSFCT